MALTVNQGPRPGPNNLDPVDPATEIEAWVNGTTVFNIPNSAFRGGGLSFVFTSTDPPASADRFPGALWFKRGDGRLYQWSVPDSPSGLTFTSADWVAVSDRRELWVRLTTPVRKGGLLIFNAQQDMLTRQPMSATARNTSRILFDCIEVHRADKNTLTEAAFIATDTGASGGLVRAVDIGLTSALMRAGAGGSPGLLYCQDTGASHVGEFFVSSTFTHPTDPGFMHYAIAVDTVTPDASNTWLRSGVFKRPSVPIGSNQYIP